MKNPTINQNNKMTFELFEQGVRVLEAENRRIDKLNACLEEICDEGFITPKSDSSSYIIDTLCLSATIAESKDWVTYWIYELNFGRDWIADSVSMEVDGVERRVKLSTIRDLWNFLHDEPELLPIK